MTVSRVSGGNVIATSSASVDIEVALPRIPEASLTLNVAGTSSFRTQTPAFGLSSSGLGWLAWFGCCGNIGNYGAGPLNLTSFDGGASSTAFDVRAQPVDWLSPSLQFLGERPIVSASSHNDFSGPFGAFVMQHTGLPETDAIANDGWAYAGPPTPWGAVTMIPRVAISPVGGVLAALWRGGSGPIEIAILDGGAWQPFSLASEAAPVAAGTLPSLAFNQSVPTLLFVDNSADGGSGLSAVSFTGSASEADFTTGDGWQYLGAPRFTQREALFFASITDTQGRLVVLARVRPTPEAAFFVPQVYRFESGAWVTVGAPIYGDATADRLAIAEAADGRLIALITVADGVDRGFRLYELGANGRWRRLGLGMLANNASLTRLASGRVKLMLLTQTSSGQTTVSVYDVP